jgi:hypothetical protein
MAKVLYGPTVAQMSGSVGGATFSRNRYGTYIRRRGHPTKVTSSYAEAAKSRLTELSRSWAGLTAGNRLAWGTWAANNPVVDKLGEKQVLSGISAYIRVNAIYMQVIGTTLLVPPTLNNPLGFEGITLTADIGEGGVKIEYEPTPLTGTNRLIYWSCVTDSPAQGYVTNLLRLTGWSSPAVVSPYDCETEIINRHGPLQVGQELWVEVGVFNGTSGLRSRCLRAHKTVVSTV